MAETQGTAEHDQLTAYLDREIKAACERLHRSIGQKARWAHADLREMAYSAHMAIERNYHFDRG